MADVHARAGLSSLVVQVRDIADDWVPLKANFLSVPRAGSGSVSGSITPRPSHSQGSSPDGAVHSLHPHFAAAAQGDSEATAASRHNRASQRGPRPHQSHLSASTRIGGASHSPLYQRRRQQRRSESPAPSDDEFGVGTQPPSPALSRQSSFLQETALDHPVATSLVNQGSAAHTSLQGSRESLMNENDQRRTGGDINVAGTPGSKSPDNKDSLLNDDDNSPCFPCLPRGHSLQTVYEIFSAAVIVVAVGAFVLETLPYFRMVPVYGTGNLSNVKIGEQERITDHPVFFVIECVCVAWFTIEYIWRFAVAPKKKAFFLDALNAVDLVAIIPFYIGLIISSKAASAVAIVRILRLTRLYRLAMISRQSKVGGCGGKMFVLKP